MLKQESPGFSRGEQVNALPLRPYQKQASDWLLDNDRGLLLLDPGLGKTIITLSALTSDRLPALVVSTKMIALNTWPQEVKKWRPELTVSVAGGSPTQKVAAFQEQADIYTISVDSLNHVPIKHNFKTLIIDESTLVREVSSLRHKRLAKIARTIPFRYGLSGTPMPNDEMDLFGQVRLIDDGALFGKSKVMFRDRYFRPCKWINGSQAVDWEPRPGASAHLWRQMEKVSVSMRSEGKIALPECTVVDHEIGYSGSFMKLYEKMAKEFLISLDILGETVTAANAAVLSGKLALLAAGAAYSEPHLDRHGNMVKGRLDVHWSRTHKIREIVDASLGSPVLIAYQYKFELERLKDEFGDLLHTKDTPDLVNRWNKGELPILAAHPGSLGHGLNLQEGGHTIIWMTPTWSTEHWTQFNARLHRSGQKNPVVIHRLYMPDTVDTVKISRVEGKRYTEQELMQHLERFN